MKIGKSLKKSFELRNDDVKKPDNSSDSFRRKNHKSRQKAKNRGLSWSEFNPQNTGCLMELFLGCSKVQKRF